jgi:hypothetical protein
VKSLNQDDPVFIKEKLNIITTIITIATSVEQEDPVFHQGKIEYSYHHYHYHHRHQHRARGAEHVLKKRYSVF